MAPEYRRPRWPRAPSYVIVLVTLLLSLACASSLQLDTSEMVRWLNEISLFCFFVFEIFTVFCFFCISLELWVCPQRLQVFYLWNTSLPTTTCLLTKKIFRRTSFFLVFVFLQIRSSGFFFTQMTEIVTKKNSSVICQGASNRREYLEEMFQFRRQLVELKPHVVQSTICCLHSSW